MAELKTRETTRSVAQFLRGVDRSRRADCETVLDLMKRATRAEPRLWGTSIVGFGSYHYKYASGREGDWFLAGFSPRKQDLTLYLPAGFDGFPDLLERLGSYRTGKSCLYLRRLSDVDVDVLAQLIRRSVAASRARTS
jgi:hypothetical protein